MLDWVADCSMRPRLGEGSWLYTDDRFLPQLQAPDFYQRSGYVEYGRIEGYPRGHAEVHFVKYLSGRSSAAARTNTETPN